MFDVTDPVNCLTTDQGNGCARVGLRGTVRQHAPVSAAASDLPLFSSSCSAAKAARAAAMFGTNVFTFAGFAAELGLDRLGASDPADAVGAVDSRPGSAAYPQSPGAPGAAAFTVRMGPDVSPDGVVLDTAMPSDVSIVATKLLLHIAGIVFMSRCRR